MMKVVQLRFLVASFAVLTLLPVTGAAKQATDASSRDFSYTISTGQPWTDTGVDLQSGDLLEITASAPSSGVPDRHAIASSPCDPNGVSGAAKSGNLPVADAAPGALIVRLQAQ